MSSLKDYYAVLGIADSAEDVVIRAAYKALAQKYHPDKAAHSDPPAHVSMVDINAAYHVLGDPIRRREYDQIRKAYPGQQQTYKRESTAQREHPHYQQTKSHVFTVHNIADWPIDKIKNLQKRMAQELGVEPVFCDKSFTFERKGLLFAMANRIEMISCPEMVVIPCGRVLPRLEIPQPFALGRFPVTNEQYLAFCRATGRSKPKESSKKKRPVTDITWFDAVSYCEWLSAETRAHYRLPDRAEWEYACRAGTTGDYYFGHLPSPKEANYGGIWCAMNGDEASLRGAYAKPAFPKSQYSQGIVDVDRYEPNPWGLFQIQGNVLEFVADIFPGDKRTACGGRWTSPVECLKSDHFLGRDDMSFHIGPDQIDYYGIGFRIARNF